MTDKRDNIWNAVFATYYDVYYEELLLEKLLSKWQLIDVLARTLISITASGSAIAGWALWERDEFKTYWAFLAGFSAILSILHTVFNVPELLKRHNQSLGGFSQLRLSFETLRYRMEIDSNFDIDKVSSDFEQLREEYSRCYRSRQKDLLNTNALTHRVQDQLNEKLQDIIEYNS